ncbi:class I SAM-dependent methyltransferase [Salegentibacter salegens]|uniref:2-polyprenyl-3-methyl-5-hydroxy-6-metoxy-1,4-benzoquinol methylase n=1 Tax=Salegentibacter salegens TaxID=143223 RepID=A0A1M7NE89_9FLAO|nr:methyltransferase domain-containing protein [Salegentibacter salegens]PRX46302.1 2-polyprenyl-3-methyl-5-hydroxy-6-metoxy-1,4-benzoquinol methylase [Salegentibacter salegens]SHN02058.1 2-polyprenyl-3-methyl-5-hydroxy-6-metoxy-1,4-benzoquinol methylase [Salegentibacter salegens]
MDLLEKSKSGRRHPWELARYEVVKSLINTHIKNYSGKKILDLGCGDLFFLNKFSEDKTDTDFYAVDTAFDEEYIKSEGVVSHIKLFNSLSNLPNEDLFFDIVFLMDVVEHIENDVTFLENLKNNSFITEKTIILITVPAYQKLFCYHDHFLGHYRRYTNSTIENVTKKAGFKTLTKGYFFTSLLLPRFIEVIKENAGKKNKIRGTRLTQWNKNNLTTQSIKKMLLFDFKIGQILKKIGINTPGLSNYLLCKIRA